MSRILFIGHDANRSGAPIILRDLIRWIGARKPEAEIDILLLSGGDLESEYGELGNVRVITAAQNSIGSRISRRLGIAKNPLSSLEFNSRDYDVVLGNTISSLPALEHFRSKGIRTICWMHELEYVVKITFGIDEFRRLAENACDSFIVPSRAVAALLDSLGITVARTIVSDFSASPDEEISPADLSQYGISTEDFVVGGAGTIEWRKGVDLLAQIARAAHRERPQIKFVWIGSYPPDRAETARMQHDIELADPDRRIAVIPSSPAYRSVLARMNVFALPSREDACPVVVFEAAKLSKPVVCFAGSGGAPDFVEDDAGKVVPAGNVDAFAEAILDYYDNREKLTAAGRSARDKVSTRFTADASCSAIYDLLQSG